jgi:hypothetical protein
LVGVGDYAAAPSGNRRSRGGEASPHAQALHERGHLLHGEARAHLWQLVGLQQSSQSAVGSASSTGEAYSSHERLRVAAAHKRDDGREPAGSGG